MKEYQVTLFCTTGQYKPVSCIVKIDECGFPSKDALKQAIRNKGLTKICQQRYWTSADLKRYNYTRLAMREYDKEKIEREKAERYEQIKKERGWA